MRVPEAQQQYGLGQPLPRPLERGDAGPQPLFLPSFRRGTLAVRHPRRCWLSVLVSPVFIPTASSHIKSLEEKKFFANARHSVITDPVIQSITFCQFGTTDLGQKGILKFFESHRCNGFCLPHWTWPEEVARPPAPGWRLWRAPNRR